MLYLEMTRHFRTWSKWWQKTLDQSQRGWRTSGIYTVIVAISYCYCYCLHQDIRYIYIVIVAMFYGYCLYQDIRYLHCYCCNCFFVIVIVYIRLMESRKSARLLNTDTDFSRLADFNIVEQVSSAL